MIFIIGKSCTVVDFKGKSSTAFNYSRVLRINAIHILVGAV